MNEQAFKERLKTIAKEKNIHFNVAWKQLILERFLLRLSKSTLVNRFIFKGGYLLAYLIDIGRETKDLDFLLTEIKAEES
jgi:predicted nucleotidyltransferase component of viral defense system